MLYDPTIAISLATMQPIDLFNKQKQNIEVMASEKHKISEILANNLFLISNCIH